MKIKECCHCSSVESIKALENVCFADVPWNNSMIEAAIESPFRHVFVLSKNEMAIAYAIMQIIGDEGEIERIGVHPLYRGNSFGKQLLLALLNQQQLETCFLEVNANNHVAHNLYCACGFEEIGRRQAYYHDGADAIMMKWKRTTDE